MSPLSVAERSARYRERQRALSSGRPANALVRAVTAQLLSASDNYRTAADIIISRSWPSDAAAAMVVKAASGTATTTTVTPAMLVADFLDVLAGASAGAAALAHGLQLRADVGYQFMFPIISANANYAGFFAEEIPIAVEQLTTNGLILSLRKFGTIVAVTRETFSYTFPTIEALVGAVLRESVSLSLDAALFSATAGSATQPPGLLVGIGASSASSETDKTVAMHADLATLISGVAAVAGSAEILVVAAPAQGRRLKLKMVGAADPGFSLFLSSALAEGTLIAIATNTLASAIDPVPRFDVSDKPTLVFDDSAPANIVVGGSVAAGSTKTIWQTDSVAMKLVLRASWGLRSSAGVCWIQNSIW